MRALLVLPFLPDPGARHGGGSYLGHLVAAMGRQAELGVIALVDEEEMGRWPALAAGWAWSCPVPRPVRRTGLAGLPARLRLLWQWRRTPLVAAKHWQPGVAAAIARARTEFRPEVAMVELAQMAQYVPLLRGVPTALTDHEAGCPANTTTGLGRWGDRRDGRLWRAFVRRHYAAAGLLQAVTAEDAAVLARELGRDVAVRPPTIAVPATPVQPAHAPPHALFVGDHRHAPNVEAATRLATVVLPQLRSRVPTAELHLAGPAGAPIGALARHPGVRVLGFVADLAATFAGARLLLAPVWSGGGFRMKVLSALAHGLPVVTNALGARGIAAPAEACVVAADDAALAAAAARWLADPGAAAAAGAAAHAWALATLSPDRVATLQLARLQQLAGRPAQALPAGS